MGVTVLAGHMVASLILLDAHSAFWTQFYAHLLHLFWVELGAWQGLPLLTSISSMKLSTTVDAPNSVTYITIQSLFIVWIGFIEDVFTKFADETWWVRALTFQVLLHLQVTYFLELFLWQQGLEVIDIDRNLILQAFLSRAVKDKFWGSEERSDVLSYALPAEDALTVDEPEGTSYYVSTDEALTLLRFTKAGQPVFDILHGL